MKLVGIIIIALPLMACNLSEVVPPDPGTVVITAPADTMPIVSNGIVYGYGKARCIIMRNAPNYIEVGPYPVVLLPPVTYTYLQVGQVGK